MTSYVVTIRYSGQSTYRVVAESPKQARDLATDRWGEGDDNGDEVATRRMTKVGVEVADPKDA